jgi:DNA-binding LacI/PurR family transcriptional regulator
MAVTIKDVAKHAGVTIGTVSRAINGYKDISPETKERIFQSIKELGYTPNVIARGLSSKTAFNIGFIVSGLLDSNDNDNLWYLMLKGVYRFASENDLEVSVYATDSKRQQKKSYARFCRERNIAGAILSGITTTDAYFKELVDSDIPCVVIDVPIAVNKVGCVSIDNIKASREMTEYLIEQNHRKFLVIAGKKNAAVTLERLAGIKEGMCGKGIDLPDSNIIYCDFSEEKAYNSAKEYILKNGKNGATAFICMSDIMAIGVINAIKDTGYAVPDDFSVTGFDDIPLAEYIRPALTTVRQDMSQNGYHGAALLKKIIEDPREVKHVYIPHEIVIRASVKKL